MSRRWPCAGAALFSALVALTGCERPQAEASYLVLGTQVDIRIEGLSESDAATLLARLSQHLRQRHRQWHAWEPGDLEQLNQAIADGECAPIDPELRNLLNRAARLEQLSDGRFNPASGHLVRAWGFHTSDYPVLAPPPSTARLRALLTPAPSLADLDLDGPCVSAAHTAIRIDLGAVAKGAIVDETIVLGRAAGATAMLINAGGDLRGFGRKRPPWRIAVRDPHSDTPLAILSLQGDEAVFTSGSYARFGVHDDRRYAHVIDPRTGAAPQDGFVSATAIAGDGVTADAAATALLLSDDESWPSLSAQLGLQHVLLIDGDGCLYVDDRLLKRLEWTRPPDCISMAELPLAAGLE